jgi:hypothetical protein
MSFKKLLGASVYLALVSVGYSSLTGYETHKSKFNASNQIRFRSHEPNTLCDGGVRSYSGWADIGKHHLFFCEIP